MTMELVMLFISPLSSYTVGEPGVIHSVICVCKITAFSSFRVTRLFCHDGNGQVACFRNIVPAPVGSTKPLFQQRHGGTPQNRSLLLDSIRVPRSRAPGTRFQGRLRTG